MTDPSERVDRLRWRRTLIIWVVVMVPFSLYNLLPTISAPSEPPRTIRDPKILTYNFTMNGPSSVQDGFATNVTLSSNTNAYNIRAYIYNWFNLQSVSALGQFQLNYSVLINGANALTGNQGIVWISKPYMLIAQGPIPDINDRENITNLHVGTNLIEFRFTQYSKLSQYGTGYYNLKLGPFTVNVSNKPASLSGPLALEGVVAILAVPASHLISYATYKIKRK